MAIAFLPGAELGLAASGVSLLVLAAALFSVPVAILVLECAAALLPRRTRRTRPTPTSRIAVLVPAHDEECGIEATLCAVRKQLPPDGRLVVVADNCTDRTAELAERAGAEVVVRVDPTRRGKGWALDFGVRHLAQDPPDIVIVIDADCLVDEGALAALTAQVEATGRPAQAIYELDRRDGSSRRDVVSALAFTVKNAARPTGLARLGLPCLLTGTGMAFPWNVIRSAPLASGNIVEDTQLGLDLALARRGARLCEDARVSGCLPLGERAAFGQRTRWEHGHLKTAFTVAPILALRALLRGRIGALALALDVCVPPLALLAAGLGAGFAIACAFGEPLAALLFGLEIALVAAGVLAAWWRFARRDIALGALLGVPWYVAWKLPLYARFLFAPERAWIRTVRNTDAR